MKPGVSVLCGIALLLAGCAETIARTRLKSSSIQGAARTVPVALLDVVVLPPEISERQERRLLSLPDEVLVKQGDEWLLVPSSVVLPVRDVLLLALRQAGLRVKEYPSLAAASRDGAEIGILCVLVAGHVSIKDKFFPPQQVRASAEVHASLVGINSGRLLWSGPLRSSVDYSHGMFPATKFGTESNAMTPQGEMEAQSARALLAQAYYHLALDLAEILQKVHEASR